MAFDVKTAGLMSHHEGHQSRIFGDHEADSLDKHAGLQSKQFAGVSDLPLFLLCELIMHSFLSSDMCMHVFHLGSSLFSLR